MPKHTPGPWGAFTGERKGTGAIERFVQPEAAPTEFGGIVAVLPLDTYPVETQTANARLIAAAPDMLKALENWENDDGHTPPTIWELRNKAIAKARGEES